MDLKTHVDKYNFGRQFESLVNSVHDKGLSVELQIPHDGTDRKYHNYYLRYNEKTIFRFRISSKHVRFELDEQKYNVDNEKAVNHFCDIVAEITGIYMHINTIDWTRKADEINTEIESCGLEGQNKEAIVKIRVNQGVFRDRLFERYNKCVLCGVDNKKLLIASHIKPWKDSKSKEKLDIDNGFLMCPNHDKLFDGGWISFDDDGKIIISKHLSEENRIFLNVSGKMKITLTENNKFYLSYHKNQVFEKFLKNNEDLNV